MHLNIFVLKVGTYSDARKDLQKINYDNTLIAGMFLWQVMTKTTEEVVRAYKKKNNPNKKVKILAICHLLENRKTIAEVSEILFNAYNTIKNWWQAFKKDGIRGLEIKKYLAVRQEIKDKTLLEFMECKDKVKNSMLFLKILHMI